MLLIQEKQYEPHPNQISPYIANALKTNDEEIGYHQRDISFVLVNIAPNALRHSSVVEIFCFVSCLFLKHLLKARVSLSDQCTASPYEVVRE